MRDNNQSDDEQSHDQQEEQEMNRLVAQAVEAAAKGEDVGQLLEFMLVQFTGPAKDRLRMKFSAALKKRGLRQPSSDADIPSRNTLARISNIFAVSAKQAFDRIVALVRSRPDIAATIDQAGKMLMKNGVILDTVQVSEADLGTMAPMGGINQTQQDRTTGR